MSSERRELTTTEHNLLTCQAALAEAQSEIARLTIGLSMLILVHAAVNFDTPEDNALRDKAVETARKALTG